MTATEVEVLYRTKCDGPCNEATSRKFGIAYAAVDNKDLADNVIRYLNDIRYVPLKPLLCLLPLIDINIASMAALSTYESSRRKISPRLLVYQTLLRRHGRRLRALRSNSIIMLGSRQALIV